MLSAKSFIRTLEGERGSALPALRRLLIAIVRLKLRLKLRLREH